MAVIFLKESSDKEVIGDFTLSREGNKVAIENDAGDIEWCVNCTSSAVADAAYNTWKACAIAYKRGQLAFDGLSNIITAVDYGASI